MGRSLTYAQYGVYKNSMLNDIRIIGISMSLAKLPSPAIMMKYGASSSNVPLLKMSEQAYSLWENTVKFSELKPVPTVSCNKYARCASTVDWIR